MTWDRLEPKVSTLLASAPVRANFQAVDFSLNGVNVVQDPYFTIWPTPTTLAHWNFSGDGTPARESGDFQGVMATKITLATNSSRFTQPLLPVLPPFLKGTTVGFGCKIKTATASLGSVGVNDGLSDTFFQHVGDNEWTWIFGIKQLDASATKLDIFIEANIAGSSGFALFDLPCLVFGQIPPQDFVWPSVIEPTLFVPLASDVVAGPVKLAYIPNTPFIVKNTTLNAETGPVGSNLIADVLQWDGAAYQSMYTSNPTILDGAISGGGDPDGVYERSCFGSSENTDSIAQAKISVNLDQAGTTPAKDLRIHVRTIQYPDLLAAFK